MLLNGIYRFHFSIELLKGIIIETKFLDAYNKCTYLLLRAVSIFHSGSLLFIQNAKALQ